MKKLICILASLYFIILLASNAFSGERLYEFNDDTAWEVLTSDWTIENDEYYQRNPVTSNAGVAVLKESEGVDTEDVEAMEVFAYDLGEGSWQNMYIVFGYNEDNPFTYLGGPFVGGAQAWRFQTFDTNGLSGIGTVKESGEALSPEKWYHVKIEFEGDDAILYGAEKGENLEEKLMYTLPDGKPSGRIGLGGTGSYSKFDDFKVSGADVQGMAVKPEDKLSITWGKIKMRCSSPNF